MPARPSKCRAMSHPGAGRGVTEGSPQPATLKRQLGVWSAGAILVGAIIGSGIFGVPAEIAREAGSVGAITLLWLLGSAITVCAALSMSELAVMFPRSGGTYVYLREAYGPMPAFVFGWTRLLLIQPAPLGGCPARRGDGRLLGHDAVPRGTGGRVRL